MAFTYDITTDIGKVRLLIGDTDITPTTDAQFSDEEIQVFIDMGGSVLMGAAKALEAWVGALSGDLLSEKIGDYSYTKKTVADKLALADKYEKQDAMIPVLEWSEMDLAAVGELPEAD